MSRAPEARASGVLYVRNDEYTAQRLNPRLRRVNRSKNIVLHNRTHLRSPTFVGFRPRQTSRDFKRWNNFAVHA